jgi:gliding motility-associated-like protein
MCSDSIYPPALCNTIETYDLFNAFNPPLANKSGTWKDTANRIIQDTVITIFNFNTGIYKYSYSRTPYHIDTVYLTVTDQLRSGTAAVLPAFCNANVNLFQSLQDSTYDKGGVWLSPNIVIDSIANAYPGTNYYTYFQKASGGCPEESTQVVVYIDSIPPRMNCLTEFSKTLEFISPYYVAIDSLNPISVSDKCNYTLKNNINNDSNIIGTHIANSTVIRWTATDESGNSATCDIILTLIRGQIPNTISPNGDGINDEWVFKLSEYYPNAIVEIYNRWGQKIWISDKGYDTNLRYWNGTDSGGEKVPVDAYEYTISDEGTIIHKGTISVIY